MTQSIRQSNLFTAEDWRKIYRAFTDINFNAYDFSTIRAALVDYVRINYPEDFNDYIESSEFVAIIDLLAYLGQSLAFRTDLNTRENFIDTAERRESILRLAKLLSYKPRRNLAGRGALKVKRIYTNDDIVDSEGNNLNNVAINWNDANNPDWFDQFTLILNNALISSNPFGQPVQRAILNGVNTQAYRLNNLTSIAGNYPFQSTVDGITYPFEVVNASIDQEIGTTERTPDPNYAMHLLYRNDGNGNQSANTGFFFTFKQGTLQFQDYDISVPMENRVLNIDVDNVNETDVWVQSVNEDGDVIENWTKVPAITGSNVIYNQIERNIRNVFTVQTRPNDQISIRFGDGRFGNVPTGLIRVWYRVSANRRLFIRPQDIRNVHLTIPFLNPRGLQKTVTFVLDLQTSVSNSQPSETNEQIRRNAPQAYYAQNRMVNGEDYNVFPLTNPNVLKLKALNRTYSGHNRFIDINDPTGHYQNTNVFSNDGLIYQELDTDYREVQTGIGISPEEIVINYVQPRLYDVKFRNFLYQVWRNEIVRIPEYRDQYFNIDTLLPGEKFVWFSSSNIQFASSGLFYTKSGYDNRFTTEPITQQVGHNAKGFANLIREGSLLRFKTAGWVTVNAVLSDGSNFRPNGQGPIRLSENVESGDELEEVIPAVRTTFEPSEIDVIENKITSVKKFAIYYDFERQLWDVTEELVDGNTFVLDGNFRYWSKDQDDTNQPNGWIILMNPIASAEGISWQIRTRGMKYVFESEHNVRFFFVNEYKTLDRDTGLSVNDTVNIFKTNHHKAYDFARPWDINTYYNVGAYVLHDNQLYIAKEPNGNIEPGTDDVWRMVNPGIGKDIVFDITGTFTTRDGYIDPRKAMVSFTDRDSDGVIDDPTIFDMIVFGDKKVDPESDDIIDYLVFTERYTSFDGYLYYRPLLNVKTFINMSDMVADYNQNRNTWSDNQVAYVKNSPINFYCFRLNVIDNEGRPLPPDEQPVVDKNKYKAYVGRTNLSFLWQHYAPLDHRIDPAITNVIDVFVLETEYDYLLRQWVVNNQPLNKLPQPSTTDQLRMTFQEFNNYKMLSDQLIWHPIKYKMIIGSRSEEELKARIKIVKIPSTSLSDGEIKAAVISNINKYFEIENWDFGETFYFSELAAYLHQQMATDISSAVLVPLNDEARFGNLYEIKCNPNEIFISCATVDDVEIVDTLTDTILRVE